MKKILSTIALILALSCVLASCNLQMSIPGEITAPSIEISEDGYWVINGEKTEVKAQGEKGDKGDQGEQGIQGEKGDKGENATASNENPLGLEFFPKDDGTYIVEIGNAKYLSKIEIPATYNGKAVSEIRNFQSENLKEVVISEGITSIGVGAFASCPLTSVTIPNSVASMGYWAFMDCTSLTSVHITDLTAWCNINFDGYESNPLSWAHNLYLDGNLVTKLIIPDSVTSIGDYAFSNCTSLTSVTIGDSVTSIGGYAFSNCTSLTSIFVDNDNTAYQSIDGNLYSKDGNTLIAYAIGKIEKSFTIPDSVTSIGDYAFSNCTSLTSITIPDSVTTIGDSAFYSCDSLTSVTIGNSVTSIGNSAFAYCGSLTSVTIGNSVTSIGGSAFYDCDGLTSITIPDSVTSIGNDAFRSCTSLTSVTIGDSVTSIGYYAFIHCTSLTSVTIPDSVTSIGNSAFYNCSKLTSVTFATPNGWWYASSADATSGTALSADSLSNPATAAQYLEWTYRDYYWFRTE